MFARRWVRFWRSPRRGAASEQCSAGRLIPRRRSSSAQKKDDLHGAHGEHGALSKKRCFPDRSTRSRRRFDDCVEPGFLESIAIHQRHVSWNILISVFSVFSVPSVEILWIPGSENKRARHCLALSWSSFFLFLLYFRIDARYLLLRANRAGSDPFSTHLRTRRASATRVSLPNEFSSTMTIGRLSIMVFITRHSPASDV